MPSSLAEKITAFLGRRKKEPLPETSETAEIKKIGLLEKYQGILSQANFRAKAVPWISFALIIAITLSVATAIAISVFLPRVSIFISLVIFLVALDIVLGYPYILALRKTDSIEEALPDALKQMADVLKAGGTYEFALREVATAEYGALTKEIEFVLRKIEEGENLENALRDFAEGIDSRLIKRAVTVIIDAVKAGAGLADMLDDIAEDIRAMHRIEKERVTETQLQVLFMIAAGAIVAPIILGLVSSIIDLFINAATNLNVNEQEIAESITSKNIILLLIQLYILVEVVAASAMIAMMRHGRIGKSIVYIPVLLLIAYIMYYGSAMASGLLLGGLQ